jgi:DNA sulfur modification protein DndB
MVAEVVEFWNVVAGCVPDWAKVKAGKISSQDMRGTKISAHSVVLRAIGGIGAELKKVLPRGDQGWKSSLAALRDIDWRKDNQEWESVCIVANSVVSNRQARVATKAHIKQKLGMELSDVERAAIGAVTLETA